VNGEDHKGGGGGVRETREASFIKKIQNCLPGGNPEIVECLTPLGGGGSSSFPNVGINIKKGAGGDDRKLLPKNPGCRPEGAPRRPLRSGGKMESVTECKTRMGHRS